MSSIPAVTLAHVITDEPIAGPWYTAWNLDPVILACLVSASAIYVVGLWRLRRRAGARAGIGRGSAAAFGAGIAALGVALISPIDPIAVELGWVHMVQHMLIMMIAAPLLVIGAPVLVSLWALPASARRRAGRAYRRLGVLNLAGYALWQPMLTWALYALTLWVWHLPALYEAALRDGLVHDAQHLAFLIAACLFWRVLLDPISHRRLNLGSGILYLFATSVHASALGVFMALSPGLWYGSYAATTPRWGVSPLADQQLAGMVMWMPACAIYGLIVALAFVVWLRRIEGEVAFSR